MPKTQTELQQRLDNAKCGFAALIPAAVGLDLSMGITESPWKIVSVAASGMALVTALSIAAYNLKEACFITVFNMHNECRLGNSNDSATV